MIIVGGLSEAAVAALFAVAYIALAGAALFLAFHFYWQRTIGAAATFLADKLRLDVSFVHWHPGNYILDASNAVANSFLAIANKLNEGAGKMMHGAGYIQGWIVHEATTLGRDILAWAVAFERGHLPKWAKALIAAAFPILLPALLARWIGKNLWKYLLKPIERAIATAVHAIPGVVHKVGAIAIPGAWGLPKLHRDVDSLWKWRKTVGRWIYKVRWVASFAGAAALVATGLRLLKLEWVRCSNVGKAGKAICRTNVKWLENALLGLTVLFGFVSLRTFAHEVSALLDDGVVAIRKFWHADLRTVSLNPGLGDTGGDPFFFQPASYVAPNPGLGDVA